jgi:hypothetical protein
MSDIADSYAFENPVAADSSLHKLPIVSAVMAGAGAIVLIVSEIWLAAAASIWAFHGLLDANLIVDIILCIAILPLSVWATWKTVVLTIEAERNPDNWVD